MAVYLGRDSAIGIAEEVTWGTAVARTRWAQIRDNSLAKKVDWAVIPDLGDNGTSLVASSYFEVSEAVTGTVNLNANYYSYILTAALKHAMGAVVDAGAGPYTHTYTMSKDPPVGLTVEIVKGTGHGEVYEGCKVSKLTLSMAVGEVMRLSLDLIGETSAGIVSAATATIPTTPTYVLHHNAGTLTINSVAYRIKSMELVIDRKIARRDGLGLLTTLEPTATDKTDVSMRCTLERVSDALETLYQAGTQADATITLTSGTKSIAITLHNAVCFSYDCPNSRVGVLEETIELRGFQSAAKTGLGIVVTNANATAV